MANNNATAKQKAQRQQHRKDHNTKADRSVNQANKGSQKGRIAARQENFNAQGNESAADFNFDQHGKGHVSGQEISHLRKQGSSKQDIMAAAKASGGELGQRAEKRFARWEAKARAKNGQDYSANGAAEEADKLKNSYIDTIRPGTTPEMDTATKNTQKQDIRQNNDQKSEINGSNNNVWQQQDNSIRQYGGDNRSFVYNGGNSGVDTPVSAATMSGFYDVDDSPSAQAAFHDLHDTLNRDAQKQSFGSGARIAGMYSGYNAASFDPAELENSVNSSIQRSYDRATVSKANVFGDPSLYQGMSDYKFGAEPKTAEYGKKEDDDDDD